MTVALALVSSGNDEHGGAVGCSDCHGSKGDASLCATLCGSLVSAARRLVEDVSATGRVARRGPGCSTGTSTNTVQTATQIDGDGRVDGIRQVCLQLIRILVQTRTWNSNLRAQRVDECVGNSDDG
jgi:hypothetical protein